MWCIPLKGYVNELNIKDIVNAIPLREDMSETEALQLKKDMVELVLSAWKENDLPNIMTIRS